ncbi:amidohydrolase family protein [Mycolicibacterium hodleri]|uniref:2-amino-3-carboxymuconate-6-semialdehyde decarboxylase n=1 Tax=Mycolicibacterium hodleri TaxID=49897 RepID=A0A502EJ30_9MYCO|nr:amidohydrolase family protein [Mycolicibacterium hodleri]TPG36506.1 amidohydrolase [Mycolicibacterium hodleri]
MVRPTISIGRNVEGRNVINTAHGHPGLIDVHTHAIDPALPDLSTTYPQDRWPRVDQISETDATLVFGGSAYRKIDHRCWSPRARIADMDRDGVALQVLSPIPVTFCYEASAAGAAELAASQNDFFARLVTDHPLRFAALGGVALQDPDRAIDELRRCVRQLGFLGVEIATQVNGTELADPCLDEFFAVAHELDALILVHPSDQDLTPRLPGLRLSFGAGMPLETTIAAAGLVGSGALTRRPYVRLCLAHGAGALPAVIGRLDKGAMMAGLDPGSADRPRTVARQLWCDSITYDRLALDAAIALFGEDHVVFGSDYPFPAMPKPLDDVVAQLPIELFRKISRTNLENHHGALPRSGPHPLPVAGRH